MPDDYRLPPEEHDQIRRDIFDQYSAGTSGVAKPRAIVLAGQPGAGKNGLTLAAMDELKSHGRAVVVDTDELRIFHADYPELQMQNDRTAAGSVQKDASKWADELAEDAMTNRRNLIIDGTLKTPENAKKLCKELRHQGYEVDVRAIAVAKEDSMQSVYARYEGMKAIGKGRWVPETLHDQAYEGLVRSIDTIDRGRYADSIKVYKRGEHRKDQPVLIHSGRGAARVLERERNRERTPDELAARDHAWNHEAASPKDRDAGIMQRIRDRDPALSEPENQRAAELAAEARDRARNAKAHEAAKPWTKHSTSPEQQKHATKFRGKGR